MRLRPVVFMIVVGLLALGPRALGQSKINPRASHPYFPMFEGGKWGFQDGKTSTWKVSPNFEEAAPFFEGLAAVKLDGKYGFINLGGEFQIRPMFDGAGRFSEGLALVRKGAKYTFVDKKGNPIGEFRFDDAGDFKEKRAAVKLDGKYGFIDPKGELVIPARYQSVQSFSNGLAAVKLDGRIGYINDKGDMKIANRFVAGGRFLAGLAPAKERDKFGYIGTNGEFVVQPKFDAAMPFTGGMFAAVKVGDVYGYIDKKGEYAIEPKFRVAEPFVGNSAFALDGTKTMVLVQKKNKEKSMTIVMEAAAAFTSNVEFRSNPAGATIYLIAKWDWDQKTDANRDSLLTDERIIAEGPTNINATVGRGTIWWVAFVLDQNRVYRRLDPDTTKRVEVKIP